MPEYAYYVRGLRGQRRIPRHVLPNDSAALDFVSRFAPPGSVVDVWQERRFVATVRTPPAEAPDEG